MNPSCSRPLFASLATPLVASLATRLVASLALTLALTLALPFVAQAAEPPAAASSPPPSAAPAPQPAGTPAAGHTHDHDHDHATTEKLGTVRFPTSCAATTAATFERGVALLHSFGYGPAAEAFREVLAADPTCAMAEWGLAMSNYHPIWAPPAPDELAAGRAAVERGVALAVAPGG